MGSVVKKSISVPEGIWAEAEATAAAENTTVSALIAEAIENLMIVRRGIRAVRAWERENGAFTADELARIESELSAVEEAARE